MPCKTYRWTPERKAEVEQALRSSSTRVEAARKLGVGTGSLDHACGAYGFSALELLGRGEPVEIEAPPAPGLTTEELLEERIKRFERRAAHEKARKLIPVRIRDDGPIGVLHFGDPHLDDDGTDIALVQRHAEIVKRTPGLYAANVGDTTNNWIGRLARLWSQQSTTGEESYQLAEWFIESMRGKWLYMVGGNHDAWSGAGDPLKWISAQTNAFYQSSEVRVALRLPGDREIRINCRHDFDGSSQWNPGHGPMKALLLGMRDHIAVAGHRHVASHSVLKDPDEGITMHAIRVASYKTFDRYARDKGFRDQNISPCALTVIDPRLPDTHPDMIKLFWCPQEGAEFLRWKRSRRAA